MAESRYGRLFTEADVIALVSNVVGSYNYGDEPFGVAECAAYRRGYAEAEIAALDAGGVLTFPADEPLFLLRGQDKATPATILHYAVLCMSNMIGASGEHIVAARAAMEAVEAWQAEHPDRVKVPD